MDDSSHATPFIFITILCFNYNYGKRYDITYLATASADFETTGGLTQGTGVIAGAFGCTHVPFIRHPQRHRKPHFQRSGSPIVAWRLLCAITARRQRMRRRHSRDPLGCHLSFSPSRQAMASSSTRTASSTAITGRAWNSKAGYVEQNL